MSVLFSLPFHFAFFKTHLPRKRNFFSSGVNAFFLYPQVGRTDCGNDFSNMLQRPLQNSFSLSLLFFSKFSNSPSINLLFYAISQFLQFFCYFSAQFLVEFKQSFLAFLASWHFFPFTRHFWKTDRLRYKFSVSPALHNIPDQVRAMSAFSSSARIWPRIKSMENSGLSHSRKARYISTSVSAFLEILVPTYMVSGCLSD